MNLRALIKREIMIASLTIILVTLGLIAFSYSVFMDVEEGETNVINFGDIAMSFCADSSCNSLVQNLGNIIGTETNEAGESVPVKVYPMSQTEGLKTTPYKFILENTGDYDLYVTIKLEPDTEFILNTEFPDYSDYTETAYSNIMIGFGEDGLNPTVQLYSALTDYKLASNILIPAGEQKIFNLYAWVKEDAPNTAQGTYFVTKISAIGEFIPNS